MLMEDSAPKREKVFINIVQKFYKIESKVYKHKGKSKRGYLLKKVN